MFGVLDTLYVWCSLFLTVVDEFSRSTWLFLMNTKIEVNYLIPHFFSMVKTQFKTKIQQLRSDNAHDFFNKSNYQYFSNLGVIHQSSCVHTPQQNGVVERKHRHILNTTHALQ